MCAIRRSRRAAPNLVDAVFPMEYSIVDSEWQETFDLYLSFNSFVGGDPNKIGMGIGWKCWDECDAPGIVRKIKYGREHGMTQSTIFIMATSGGDDAPLIDVLTIDSEDNDYNAPYKDPVPSCLSP